MLTKQHLSTNLPQRAIRISLAVRVVFGKSLLLSTLEAYFCGKKELFEGLAIEQLETEWNEHAVLHLDLNAEDYSEIEGLRNGLELQLRSWEKSMEPVRKV